jgi:hypothetical protein
MSAIRYLVQKQMASIPPSFSSVTLPFFDSPVKKGIDSESKHFLSPDHKNPYNYSARQMSLEIALFSSESESVSLADVAIRIREAEKRALEEEEERIRVESVRAYEAAEAANAAEIAALIAEYTIPPLPQPPLPSWWDPNNPALLDPRTFDYVPAPNLILVTHEQDLAKALKREALKTRKRKANGRFAVHQDEALALDGTKRPPTKRACSSKK